MRRALLAGASAVVVLATNAYADQIVPDWEWVEPRLGTGADSCGIEAGGLVSEIGRDGRRVLVRYTPPQIGDTGGTPCDGGEVFWLKEEDFSSMTARYLAVEAAAKKDDDIVRKLIDAGASR